MVDQDTQIKILLYGNPLQFACETLGVSDMRKNSYADVFTVTEADVFAYTEKHGFPDSPSIDRLTDGFHYYEEQGVWYIFFRERGKTFDQQQFTDTRTAKAYIVSMLLKLTMTGLY
ncbi:MULTISPECIES: hypothetical protein [Exiguobacterium]|uniref:hypothetical protein n=1 Tax=Exiguobacterium TaxID=33986 RepID=UPI00047D774B|nr:MULTISPECIES: hypothetical protein [Exiguobacterium]MCT4780578.1 hypothetical protein [Exiguobacterium soli]